MQHFPSSGPATNSGHGSSNAPGCHPPHTGTPGAGARGADQCHATANQQHPQETSGPALVGRGHREPNPPGDGVPPLPWPCCCQGGAGWVNPPPPWLGQSQPKKDARGRSLCWLLYSGSLWGRGGGSQVMTRFQTGSAATVPGLLNAPVLPRGTGHPPAATPTAGPRPPLLASPWHSWGREQGTMEGEQENGAEQQPQCSGIRNLQSLWSSPPQAVGTCLILPQAVWHGVNARLEQELPPLPREQGCYPQGSSARAFAGKDAAMGARAQLRSPNPAPQSSICQHPH